MAENHSFIDLYMCFYGEFKAGPKPPRPVPVIVLYTDVEECEFSACSGNLGRHLNNRHPGYDQQQGDGVIQVPQQQPISVAKKPQPQVKPVPVDFDHLNWFLLKGLIEGSLPLSTFEDEGLTNSFKFLNPSVKLWSRERVQAVILEVYRSMREDTRASVLQVKSSKISITLDFWSNYEQICYMSITVHWIDENWTLHKLLLDISHIPYHYGDHEIHHALLKVLKMFNFDDSRILSCTHDNSQSTINACRMLKKDLDGRKLPGSHESHFFYIPCAARTLNLIIEDGLGTAKQIISKVQEFVLEMNASLEIAQDFRQMAAAYQEGSWKIPLDASMRWSGKYTMLDVVRKAYAALDTAFKKHEGNPANRSTFLTAPEKNYLISLHSFLESFHKTTTNLCTSKSPTLGLALFFMDHINEMIGNCSSSRANPEALKVAANDMAEKAQTYSSQVYNLSSYMAAILDPRIKGELLPEDLNAERYLEGARHHFMRWYSFPGIPNGYSSQDTEEGSSVSFAEEIARKRRRMSMTASSTDELTQYLSEPPVPIATDVLDWWKANSTRYPKLSLMARDYLAVQATSVAPDELFSAKGDDIDKRRICLPHGCAQPILCIRAWAQSGYKFKFRSKEIDFDRLIDSTMPAFDNATSAFDRKQK
ncbi:putative AC transposase isoform X2 [Magnolia sinica]|uniref:putative AC transposase isoform X2 n=1 Tax=Magnolia sinica TaxID=86752 RepID=UPI00265972A0|nr:putative AC transposase isoform X2 [Magnolia sinica]